MLSFYINSETPKSKTDKRGSRVIMSMPPLSVHIVNPLKTTPNRNGPTMHPNSSQMQVANAIATDLYVLGTYYSI